MAKQSGALRPSFLLARLSFVPWQDHSKFSSLLSNSRPLDLRKNALSRPLLWPFLTHQARSSFKTSPAFFPPPTQREVEVPMYEKSRSTVPLLPRPAPIPTQGHLEVLTSEQLFFLTCFSQHYQTRTPPSPGIYVHLNNGDRLMTRRLSFCDI